MAALAIPSHHTRGISATPSSADSIAATDLSAAATISTRPTSVMSNESTRHDEKHKDIEGSRRRSARVSAVNAALDASARSKAPPASDQRNSLALRSADTGMVKSVTTMTTTTKQIETRLDPGDGFQDEYRLLERALDQNWSIGLTLEPPPRHLIREVAELRVQERRSSRLGRIVKSTTDTVQKISSTVLGKRPRGATDSSEVKVTRSSKKQQDRRTSLRPRVVAEPQPTTTHKSTEEGPAKKKVKTVEFAAPTSVETVPVMKTGRRDIADLVDEILGKGPAKKRWLNQGLYLGQDQDFNPNLSTSQNRRNRASSGMLGRSVKRNKSLPLPMFAGDKLLKAGRPFKLPFDIYSPLPKGEPKPTEYKKIQSNRFVGDAAGVWKHEATLPASYCICDEDEDGCDNRCLNRIMGYECDDTNCAIGRDCGNRQFSDLKDRLKTGRKFDIGVDVVQTENKGHGVRASRSFHPGQIILEYAGEIITQDECDRRVRTEYKHNECFYLMEFTQNMILDATRGSIARFVNHSCDPNCVMEKWTVLGKPRMALFAGPRGVLTGEELTYDYNFEKKISQPIDRAFERGGQRLPAVGSEGVAFVAKLANTSPDLTPLLQYASASHLSDPADIAESAARALSFLRRPGTTTGETSNDVPQITVDPSLSGPTRDESVKEDGVGSEAPAVENASQAVDGKHLSEAGPDPDAANTLMQLARQSPDTSRTVPGTAKGTADGDQQSKDGLSQYPDPPEGYAEHMGQKPMTALAILQQQGYGPPSAPGPAPAPEDSSSPTQSKIPQKGRRVSKKYGPNNPRRIHGAFTCAHCGSHESAQRRSGPLGSGTLCNACGLRWQKAKKGHGRGLELGGHGRRTAKNGTVIGGAIMKPEPNTHAVLLQQLQERLGISGTQPAHPSEVSDAQPAEMTVQMTDENLTSPGPPLTSGHPNEAEHGAEDETMAHLFKATSEWDGTAAKQDRRDERQNQVRKRKRRRSEDGGEDHEYDDILFNLEEMEQRQEKHIAEAAAERPQMSTGDGQQNGDEHAEHIQSIPSNGITAIASQAPAEGPEAQEAGAPQEQVDTKAHDHAEMQNQASSAMMQLDDHLNGAYSGIHLAEAPSHTISDEHSELQPEQSSTSTYPDGSTRSKGQIASGDEMLEVTSQHHNEVVFKSDGS